MTDQIFNGEQKDKTHQSCGDTDKLGFGVIMAQSIRDADQNKDGITTKNEIAKAIKTADNCPSRYLQQAEIEFDYLTEFAPQSLKEMKFEESVDDVKNSVWKNFGDVREDAAGISEKDLSITASLGNYQKYDRFVGDFMRAESEYRNTPFAYATATGVLGLVGTASTGLVCPPCAPVAGGVTLGGTLVNIGRGIVRNMTYRSELPEFQHQLQNRLEVLDRMHDRIRKLD